MSAVIRLARHGAPKKPFYRIIAAHKGSKRDTSFIEVLGTYDPMINPPLATLKVDRIKHWIEVGAQPSDTVATIIKKNITNYLEPRLEHQRKKIQAARKARKARAAKGAKKKK